MANANPIEELKSLRDELTSFTLQYKAGDAVPANEARRIDSVLARGAELAEAIQRGEKSAANIAATAQGGFEYVDGTFSPAGAKSMHVDFSYAGAKAMAQRAAGPSIKALVAGGSSATQVALEPAPIHTPGARPAAGLLDYFEVKQRSTPVYKYLRQSVRTNAAAVVAAGGTKPTSVFTVEEVTNTLKVFAHLSEPVDKYLAQDNSELVPFLATELQDGLFNKVEADVISTILGTSGVQTKSTTAGFTGVKGFDVVYDSLMTLRAQGNTPDLIVIHPTDYQAMRLAKDAENRYYGGSAFEGGADAQLWGTPTAVTAAIAQGTALVISTDAVRISTDTQGVAFETDPYTGFATNTVCFRNEGRFATDVKLPGSIVKITFTA